MGRVVINRCYGGFGLSDFALNMLEERGFEVRREDWGSYLVTDINRHDPALLEVVETLGQDANGFCANLEIVEFEGSVYRIDEYDGLEQIVTPENQSWCVIA